MNPNITSERSREFLNEMIRLFVSHFENTVRRISSPMLLPAATSDSQVKELRILFGRAYLSGRYEISVDLITNGASQWTSERVLILKTLTVQERKRFAHLLAAEIKKLAYPDKDQRVDYRQVKPRYRSEDHGAHRLRSELERMIDTQQSFGTISIRYEVDTDQFILGQTGNDNVTSFTTWSIQPRA